MQNTCSLLTSGIGSSLHLDAEGRAQGRADNCHRTGSAEDGPAGKYERPARLIILSRSLKLA